MNRLPAACASRRRRWYSALNSLSPPLACAAPSRSSMATPAALAFASTAACSVNRKCRRSAAADGARCLELYPEIGASADDAGESVRPAEHIDCADPEAIEIPAHTRIG